MPRKGHTEEQIMLALRQVETGKKMGEPIRCYLMEPLLFDGTAQFQERMTVKSTGRFTSSSDGRAALRPLNYP